MKIVANLDGKELKINLDSLYYVTKVFQIENPQAAELMNDINNSINTIEYYRKRSLRWKQKKHKLNIWRI